MLKKIILKFVVTLIFVAVYVGVASELSASGEESKNETTANEVLVPKRNELNTAEIVERRLRYDRTKRLPVFGRIQKALDLRKYKAVLLEAKTLEKNEEFKDYFHFISGKAELGRLKFFRRTKKIANAIYAGDQAIYHLEKVPSANPYDSLNSASLILLGETKIHMGAIYHDKHKRKKAMKYFEEGFQHLKKKRKLAVVPQDYIISYAVLCDRKPSLVCGGWERELASYVDERSKARIMRRISKIKLPRIKREKKREYRRDLDYDLFDKGFAFYLAGEYADAFATFKNLLETYPKTNIELRTKFWMARSAQKAGQDQKAQTLYREVIRDIPFSYFALLSSWYGKINISRMIDAEVPMASPDASFLSATDVVHLERAEKFIASGAPKFARYELNQIYPTAVMPNEFVVYLTMLNHIATNHVRAFQMYGELGTRDYKGLISTYGQKFLFPTTFATEIYNQTKVYDVNPLLVFSIIKQESAFLYDAVSRSNAYGLMQIIAPTARDLDKKISISDLFKPKKNIALGSKYIAQLLKRFDGNVILALAAYNAGPSNAKRWEKNAPDSLTPEEFVELIAYNETRTYVQNILRNIYWYTKRMKKTEFQDLKQLIAEFQSVETSSSTKASSISKR